MHEARSASNINHLQISPARFRGLQARLEVADIRARIAPDSLMPIYINESILRRSPEELIKAFVG
jgi:hypothetical protein